MTDVMTVQVMMAKPHMIDGIHGQPRIRRRVERAPERVRLRRRTTRSVGQRIIGNADERP